MTHCEKAPEGVLLYTKTQMAALLQVSMRCLNEMMANGQISYLKIGGKLVRFRASHVLRRLKETSFVCHGEAAEIRNPNGEIRNKSEMRRSNDPTGAPTWN